jgi:hypothetical protein
MLDAAKKAGQITHDHGNRYTVNRDEKKVVPDENNSKTTLSDAGISRKLSSEAQQIASIPKENLDFMWRNEFQPRLANVRNSTKSESGETKCSGN